MNIEIMFKCHTTPHNWPSQTLWKIVSLKPHYLVIKIHKTTHMQLFYNYPLCITIIMQLWFGYYNYYAIIPLEIWCINK
jgi:hypothetical protein